MTEAEFEKIYLENFEAVHKYLLKLCRNAEVADEITGETFFKAMSAINRFEGKCSVQSWLCGIAKNSYFSYLKETKRSFPLDGALEKSGAEPGMEEQVADDDASMRILKALHALPEPYKEVFNLRVFGELSFKQIGSVFGKTEDWACVTYHRAKSKIQAKWEETK